MFAVDSENQPETGLARGRFANDEHMMIAIGTTRRQDSQVLQETRCNCKDIRVHRFALFLFFKDLVHSIVAHNTLVHDTQEYHASINYFDHSVVGSLDK